MLTAFADAHEWKTCRSADFSVLELSILSRGVTIEASFVEVGVLAWVWALVSGLWYNHPVKEDLRSDQPNKAKVQRIRNSKWRWHDHEGSLTELGTALSYLLPRLPPPPTSHTAVAGCIVRYTRSIE